MSEKPEVYCCCGRPYTAHWHMLKVTSIPYEAPEGWNCPAFTPRPPDYDIERPGPRLCDHGFEHWSCGWCCPRQEKGGDR